MASSSSVREIEPSAARADRRKQPARRVADQEEKRVGRRLLENLEQGVGASLFELVDAVDDRDAPGRHRSGQPHELAQRADLVDADVAGETFAFLLRQAARASACRDGFRPRRAWRSDARQSVAMPGRSNGGPAASASTRRAAAWAKLALPTPFGPASSQAWCSFRVAHALANWSTARPARRSWQQVPRLRRAAAP